MRCVALLLACLALAGCSYKTAKEVTIPDARPVLAALEATEATVLGQSASIWDATKFIVTASLGTPQEAEIKEAAAKIEASLADIKTTLAENPSANAEKLIKALLTAIQDLKKIITRIEAENAELRDRNASLWYWLLYGGAALCTVGAPAVFFYGASLSPIFGPRIAGMLAVAAVTLYAMGYAYQWVREHPFYTGLGFAALFVAVGLAWGNKVRHAEDNSALPARG